ncbi:O-antigen ligase family protein [Lichenifustis flavocetrariae]|uniref:O-antigen ligase family protein n=1 Tax=Lichenifustis flavocetrariae TaxID=2949735 RepID=A0AA41Z6P2_9HYPH|nr:O-antigen ligase family protein [Lichenifustis flavocetrariae]MCW6511335.1 O-antigen ligase family protein [Lichenifustis flavocetrariae]
MSAAMIPAAAAVLLLCGLFFVTSPLSAVILLVGMGVTIILAHRPLWAFMAFLFAQIICPLYLAIPIVPFLPPFPASLLILGITAAIIFVRSPPRPSGRIHPITIAFTAYGLALLLSVLTSHAPLSNLNGVIRCFAVPITVYAFTRRLVRSSADAILPLNTLLLGCVLISLYGVVEFTIGWNPLIENLAEPTGEQGDLLYWGQRESTGFIYRSFSVEMNPLYFGTTVSMLFPYCLGRFGLAETPKAKSCFATAAFACLAGVATTFSRGPLIAMLMAAVGIAVVFRAVRPAVVVTLLCAVAGGAALIPWLGPEIWERFSDPDNVAMRLKLWQVAWSMFLDHPATGVGLDGFTFHQLDVLRANEIGPFPEHYIGELESVGTADGTFPQLAAEVGVPGLVSFLAMFVTAGAAVLQGLRGHDTTSRLVAAAAGIAACAYVINGLTITIYTAYTPTIVLSFFFALLASMDDAEQPIADPNLVGWSRGTLGQP